MTAPKIGASPVFPPSSIFLFTFFAGNDRGYQAFFGQGVNSTSPRSDLGPALAGRVKGRDCAPGGDGLRTRSFGLIKFFFFLTAGMAFLLVFPTGTPPLHAAQVTLAWDPNSEAELAGYKVYYGTSSRKYSACIDVGKSTTAIVPLAEPGMVYYLAVTSYDPSGNESQFSEELSYPEGPKCDFSYSLTSLSFIASGGSGIVTVQVQPGCAWSVSSQASWLTITSGPSGSGPGAVQFSLSPNTSPDARTAGLTVAGNPVSLHQEGALPAGATLLALKAGGPSFMSASGILFQADNYFLGGESRATDQAIRRTNDPTLYQTARNGTFSYSIPLPRGTYEVTLKFAELNWNAKRSRVFDVFVEGVRVAKQLDLFAVAGKNSAYDMSFLVQVTDGALDLNFLPLAGEATVSGILVRSAPDSEKPLSVPQKLKKYSSGEMRNSSK